MNEKGFTFPLLLAVLVVFCLLVPYSGQVYTAEKRFYKEMEHSLIQENLLRLALMYITEELGNKGIEVTNGFLYFNNGQVQYECTQIEENIFQVKLTSTTKDTVLNHAIFQYDREQKKVIKWTERT